MFCKKCKKANVEMIEDNETGGRVFFLDEEDILLPRFLAALQ